MSLPDDDLFGPPPEPPHPVEHRGHRPRAPIVEAPDPRNSPAAVQLRERIRKSRYLQDVCTCGIGDADRAITEARKPKCCKACPWCNTRVKNAYYKEHIAWCMAVERTPALIPWWRRTDALSSRQRAGGGHAKPIEQASAVHGDGGPQPREGPKKGSTAGQRSEGVRRSRSRKRPAK